MSGANLQDTRNTHSCYLVEFTLEGEAEAVEICNTGVTRVRRPTNFTYLNRSDRS